MGCLQAKLMHSAGRWRELQQGRVPLRKVSKPLDPRFRMLRPERSGIANLGLYLYTEKYTQPQALIGLLFTAVIDFAIAILSLYRRKKR